LQKHCELSEETLATAGNEISSVAAEKIEVLEKVLQEQLSNYIAIRAEALEERAKYVIKIVKSFTINI
jgi:hypothetical protein